ncbi:hypothetical protein DFAR_2690037 [Desulfarculales bacterium]
MAGRREGFGHGQWAAQAWDRGALERLTLPLAVVDQQGRLAYANPFFLALAGS